MSQQTRAALGAVCALALSGALASASNTKGIQRLSPTGQPTAPPMGVRALVIGVSDFKSLPADQDLPHGAADADLAAETLQRAVSPIELLVLKDREASFARVREEVQGLLRRTTEREAAVIWAVTHGARVGTKGYLLAADSVPEGRLSATALSVESLKAEVERSRAGSVFLFMDTVHGELKDAAGVRSGPEHSLSSLIGAIAGARDNVFALLSEEVSSRQGACPGHGAYTCAVKQAMEGSADVNGDGAVSLPEVARLVPQVLRSGAGQVEAAVYGRYDDALAFQAPAPEEIVFEPTEAPARWAPPPEQVEVCLFANGSAVSADHAFRTGDRFALSLAVPRSGHMAVMNVGPDGAENMLYPLGGEDGRVSAGTTLDVLPADHPNPMVLTPPEGDEKVYVVWSQTPLLPGPETLAFARRQASSSETRVAAWTTVTRTKGIGRLSEVTPAVATAPRCQTYAPQGSDEAWVLDLTIQHR